MLPMYLDDSVTYVPDCSTPTRFVWVIQSHARPRNQFTEDPHVAVRSSFKHLSSIKRATQLVRVGTVNIPTTRGAFSRCTVLPLPVFFFMS